MWKRITPKLQTKKKKMSPNYRRHLYIFTNLLMEQLGISQYEKQQMLYDKYGKWSRKQLSDTELDDFTTYLENILSKKYETE